MRPLNVEFAEYTPHWVWLGLALVALALGMTAVQVEQFWRLHRQSQALQAREAAAKSMLDARRQASAARLAKPVETPYLADAQQATVRASFDVGQVLGVLEAARVPGLRLLALEVSTNNRSVQVDVELHDVATLSAYIESLSTGGPVRRWVLVKVAGGSGGTAAQATIIGSGPSDEFSGTSPPSFRPIER